MVVDKDHIFETTTHYVQKRLPYCIIKCARICAQNLHEDKRVMEENEAGEEKGQNKRHQLVAKFVMTVEDNDHQLVDLSNKTTQMVIVEPEKVKQVEDVFGFYNGVHIFIEHGHMFVEFSQKTITTNVGFINNYILEHCVTRVILL